tara:strand:+ start:677 stop:1099 length:423 start_codon:yes stop_codon:yes gene_type:complete
MNITKITKNNSVILKNKGNNTVYRVNKLDSVVTFRDKDYNIDDSSTAKNLIYMLIDKCAQDDDLIDDYKTLLKDKEGSHNECRKTNVKLRDKNKQLERDIRQSDNNLSDCLDNLNATEKEKNKIEDSIKIFFRLNEKIIK